MPPSICSLGTVRRYGRGEFVYQQGQLSSHFFILISGRVRIFISLPDGTERVLCYVEVGASFGESACFDGLPYFVTSVAVTPCQCRVVSRDAVLAAIAGDPMVALDLAQALSRKSRVLVMHLASDRMCAGDRVVLLLDQLVRACGVTQVQRQDRPRNPSADRGTDQGHRAEPRDYEPRALPAVRAGHRREGRLGHRRRRFCRASSAGCAGRCLNPAANCDLSDRSVDVAGWSPSVVCGQEHAALHHEPVGLWRCSESGQEPLERVELWSSSSVGRRSRRALFCRSR